LQKKEKVFESVAARKSGTRKGKMLSPPEERTVAGSGRRVPISSTRDDTDLVPVAKKRGFILQKPWLKKNIGDNLEGVRRRKRIL